MLYSSWKENTRQARQIIVRDKIAQLYLALADKASLTCSGACRKSTRIVKPIRTTLADGLFDIGKDSAHTRTASCTDSRSV
jgi:hypothetical protein